MARGILLIGLIALVAGCAVPPLPGPRGTAQLGATVSIAGPEGDFSLTVPAGWQRVDPALLNDEAILAVMSPSEDMFALVFAADAMSRSLDDLVDQRRRHLRSVAHPKSFAARERRYFIDSENLLPASLATYTYVSTKSGRGSSGVVLTVIAQGRAYEVVGLGANDDRVIESLSQAVTGWKQRGTTGARRP